MKDRYFLGAFLMLFRRKEEFFIDLILKKILMQALLALHSLLMENG